MKTFFTKYWWVLLIIALAILAYFQRKRIMSWFKTGKPKDAGDDVPPTESCASPQRIVQRASLKEGETDCPKPLYMATGNAKERSWIKEDICWTKITKALDGTGPWYFNYEKGNRCYYINNISNPLTF